MGIKIIDTIEAFKRTFAIVLVDDRYITLMYLSSGSAGVMGWWFPFCGIKTTNKEDFNGVARLFTENDYGWIVKVLYAYDILDNKKYLAYDSGNLKGDHRNPYLRLKPTTSMPINFHEISVYLSSVSDLPCKYPRETLGKHGISEVGINAWLKDTVVNTIKEVKERRSKD